MFDSKSFYMFLQNMSFQNMSSSNMSSSFLNNEISRSLFNRCIYCYEENHLYICKTGNGWQNNLLADGTDTDWRSWHWLTGLTLAEENNFWLKKLILLIENKFYEVINLSYNLLFILTLLC